MYYIIFPLFFGVVVGKPVYVGSPLSLEHGYPGLTLHHLSQASALFGQPLSLIYGNLDQFSTLSKSLLAGHLGTQKAKGIPVQGFQFPVLHPANLVFASPLSHHESPITIKKDLEFPDKKIAGALIQQVPKVSKLPISVSFPKSLQFSSLGQGGFEGRLTGASILSGKNFLSGLDGLEISNGF